MSGAPIPTYHPLNPRRWALVAVATLVGGSCNFVEAPFGWGRSALVSEQKTGRCLPLLVASPVDKADIEYKGFASVERGVNVSLCVAIALEWNVSGANFGVIFIPRRGIMEQCMPNRGSLSSREEAQTITCFVSGQWRIGNKGFIRQRNMFDRVNFEIPIPTQGRFSSGIDESQQDRHGLCDGERAVIRSVYTHPSPVSFNGGIVRINYAPINKNQTDESDNSASSSYEIKPFRYPDLPFPEFPLVGAVLLFFGLRASNRGLEHGPFALLMGGW
ncbi:MAG TPA: hypothetical protein VHB27_07020, partial [Rhodopila sp.]|uniref:hypothetical protein n=1 Tax=Rhodopila sp. TaxID=2480087 RepID=UPI002BE035AD